jgi:hypothetical protein
MFFVVFPEIRENGIALFLSLHTHELVIQFRVGFQDLFHGWGTEIFYNIGIHAKNKLFQLVVGTAHTTIVIQRILVG